MDKKTTIVPRFQGRAYQEGNDWKFEVFISIGGDSIDPIRIGTHKTYPDKDAALKEMKSMIPDLVKTVCEAIDCGTPEALIDLKKGEMIDIDAWKTNSNKP